MLELIGENFIINIKNQCALFIVIATASTVAMIIDLVFGIKKANERKEFRTSEGYKRTVDKALKYYCLLLLCLCIDIIKSVYVLMPPLFSALGGFYICFCEFKSWMEKAGDKERRQIIDLAKLYINKKDLINEIIKEIESNEFEKKSKGAEQQ